MSCSDILVHLDETPVSRHRATAAVSVAKRLGAPVTGVFLKTDLMRDYMTSTALTNMSPADIDAALKAHDKALAAAERKARAFLESAAKAEHVESDWLAVDGDDDEAMIACARRFDLTVFPAVTGKSLGPHRISAPTLALSSGGPVLVVPARAPARVTGDRVLVAWKGTRESARALHDAAPFLRRASEVFVLTVSPDPQDGESGLLDRHLERCGVKARLIDERRRDGAAAGVIRKHIAALNIDLLVMGLYGRPRLQELILGGVSDDLIHAPPCAILTSH